MDVDVDLHNGGVFFVKYFFFEAVVAKDEVKIYKCFVESTSNPDVVERVEGNRGVMIKTDKKSVFNVDLVSSYNSKYAVRSCILFDDENMIVFKFDDNSSRLFWKV